MADAFLDFMSDRPVERQRYSTLKETIAPLASYFAGRRILDFGASYALSMCVLIELGAEFVVGVEPDEQRVAQGNEILSEIGYGSRTTLLHVSDTRTLPFRDGDFDTVLANAVFEHIPQPRERFVQEVWRVLAPSGVLLINETPNKYLPRDYHTTGLWFLPWLPSRFARQYALLRRRFSPTADWASSGWRGVGYYEIFRSIGPGVVPIPHLTRPRHHLLHKIGLPPGILDPYPTMIFQKSERISS